MKKYTRINRRDNVAVALAELKKGDIVRADHREIVLLQDVGPGHKIALKDITEGQEVIKYGSPIGHSTRSIKAGEHVHTHNLKTNLKGLTEYQFNPKRVCIENKNESLTFLGYRRSDGKVGIRNELWIVPTVGCVNGPAEAIMTKFKAEVDLKGIDAIEIFKHEYGCSQLGQDHINTRTILGNIVKHPNAGGVLVLGLGCENNHVEAFRDSLGEYDKSRIKFLVVQEVDNEIETGVKLLKELYNNMNLDTRVKVPINELIIGLKCGGSDGFSGITANPLLGAFSDLLVSQGGTTVLTEVPEMFGAENLLMERAKDEQVFNKIVNMINNFKEYYMKYHQPIYENPSPGNKAGGITTLEEKSLGCTQKGGKATVVDVLDYGETVKTKGLNLLSAPGNDLVASTALGAAGCHIILFTTGRGTPFGSFVPTLKISTNTKLYQSKPHWIDFDAGSLLEDRSMEEVVKEFIDYIVRVASGELVNNEKNKYKEIAIFKTGVTL